MSNLPNPSFTLLTEGLSAFAGAFFAFIFLRLAEFLLFINEK